MKRLGVNVDHVATLRQARRTVYPDPVVAASDAIRGGANQITIHLREDRRHILDADVERMKKAISVPLNLEMAAVDEIAKIACRIKPHTATLVPERREELTTEGGLRVTGNENLRAVVERLKDAGISVSLFIDPVEEEVIASRELGVDIIELHTGTYCDVPSESERDKEFTRLKVTAEKGSEIGLIVAAGHGLHYENTKPLVEGIPLIEEYNIGHSIVARAIFVGMERAVKEMKVLMEAT
jgi:pyridoxine 5-phosphate synthase